MSVFVDWLPFAIFLAGNVTQVQRTSVPRLCLSRDPFKRALVACENWNPPTRIARAKLSGAVGRCLARRDGGWYGYRQHVRSSKGIACGYGSQAAYCFEVAFVGREMS
jgi:hypothetical protein